jgi:hypothetical protein
MDGWKYLTTHADRRELTKQASQIKSHKNSLNARLYRYQHPSGFVKPLAEVVHPCVPLFAACLPAPPHIIAFLLAVLH